MKKVFSILFIAASVLFISCDKPTVSNDGQTTTTQMDWGTAFHYANISTTHQGTLTFIGVLFILGSLFFAYKVWVKKEFWCIGYQPAVFFGGLIIALLFISIAPNKVRMDNCYDVPTQYFKDSGQTHILDSLYKNNLLIGAAVK